MVEPSGKVQTPICPAALSWILTVPPISTQYTEAGFAMPTLGFVGVHPANSTIVITTITLYITAPPRSTKALPALLISMLQTAAASALHLLSDALSSQPTAFPYQIAPWCFSVDSRSSQYRQNLSTHYRLDQ